MLASRFHLVNLDRIKLQKEKSPGEAKIREI